MSNKWDARFLQLASVISQWSKDPSTKVGTVIVRPDRTIVSTGYNGLPRSVMDNDERLKNRDAKLLYTIHAELNAILTAHTPLRYCTVYTTHQPCAQCMGAIIQAGVVRVVYISNPEMEKRWQDHLLVARGMAVEAKVQLSYLTHAEMEAFHGKQDLDQVDS